MNARPPAPDLDAHLCCEVCLSSWRQAESRLIQAQQRFCRDRDISEHVLLTSHRMDEKHVHFCDMAIRGHPALSTPAAHEMNR